MPKRVQWFSCTAILTIAWLAGVAQDQASPRLLTSVGPILSQDSMNVFRRFAVEPKAMYEFYGEVLGLKQLTTFDVGANTNVARFQAGDSQLKLTTKVPNRQYHPGAVAEATGVRLITLYFPDQKAMADRFRAHGLPLPEFQPITGSNRSHALVKDPDGQFVEVVIAPDAPADVYRQIEVGLTVSDLAASRKFYREFVGLEELPPVNDPLFHVKKYPFRHGTTTINLLSFGKPLPADTGSGGIQYVVSDAKAVDTLAKARQIAIETPLSTLQSFALTTVWLDDPDGITNYFAQVGVPGPPRGR
jgi:catechol 2,3-dioxygenase-like lactoylglutathione lyase family enzyme